METQVECLRLEGRRAVVQPEETGADGEVGV